MDLVQSLRGLLCDTVTIYFRAHGYHWNVEGEDFSQYHMLFEQIYEDIWGYDFGPDSKALAVYIGYLRRKTEQDGEPRIVQTVRGVGYTLRAS